MADKADAAQVGVLLVGYPPCSTCKKAEKFLEAAGISYEYRNIKEEKPTETELKSWHAASSLPLKRFFNTSGMIYRERKIKDLLPSLTEEEQYKLLAEDGMLVKRPIIIANNQVSTGFKEDEWKRILNL